MNRLIQCAVLQCKWCLENKLRWPATDVKTLTSAMFRVSPVRSLGSSLPDPFFTIVRLINLELVFSRISLFFSLLTRPYCDIAPKARAYYCMVDCWKSGN